MMQAHDGTNSSDTDHHAAENRQPTPAERRPDLKSIVDAANQSPLRPPQLGEFRIASIRSDADIVEEVQIGAGLPSRIDGIEFRHTLPLRAFDRLDVASCTTELLSAASAFIQRPPAESEIEQARSAVGRYVAGRGRGPSPPTLAAIGFSKRAGGAGHAITVDVEMLGDDLSIGTERTTGYDLDDTLARLTDILDRHARREAACSKARTADVGGWIDAAALQILDLSGFGRAAAFAHLSSRVRLPISFTLPGGKEVSGAVRWQEGTIVGELHQSDGDWSFEVDHLTIPHPGTPETVLNTLEGHSIGGIIDQPVAPACSIITGLPDAPPGWLYIDLAIPSLPLDRTTGLPVQVPPEGLQ